MYPQRTHTYDTKTVGDAKQCIAVTNSSALELKLRAVTGNFISLATAVWV